jgi:hypothetical protein
LLFNAVLTPAQDEVVTRAVRGSVSDAKAQLGSLSDSYVTCGPIDSRSALAAATLTRLGFTDAKYLARLAGVGRRRAFH